MPTLTLETRRAPFAPSSWNADTRTIEAVISTGSDVQRRDSRGPFIERLDVSAIDVASLAGIPVLDGHRQTGSEHVVGVVDSARREGSALVAVIRLSAAADVASTVGKVEEGILRGVSVGYAVTRWIDSTDPQTKSRVRTAANWIIREVSLVSIPADPAAQIRSDGENMPEAITTPETPTVVTPPVTDTRAALNAQIRSLAETAGLDRTWADAQIDGAADLASARSAALDAVIERTAGATGIRAHVGVDHTDPAVTVTRQAEALAYRMGGPEASDAARPYMDLGFAELARDALVRSGVNVGLMSRETLIQRAMLTTSDFPQILDQAGTRVVENAYQVAESPLKAVARRRLVSDLRDVTVLKAGEVSSLHKVTESGEIKSLTMGEGAQGYPIVSYAGIVTLSRKLLLNDSFGVWGDAATRVGQAAAATEAEALFNLLIGASGLGPILSDGRALFHVDHGNFTTGGFDPDITLEAGRAAMRKQTGIDGVSPVNVVPKFLLVGPDMESPAEKLLTLIQASKAEDLNVFAGKLTLLVEPRITDDSAYIFGDPATAPVLEMAYLASAPGPQVSSRDGWDVLGREFRVVLDLGVGATDYRGAYFVAPTAG